MSGRAWFGSNYTCDPASGGGLSDLNSHPPPSSGLYAYDTWKPGVGGFPTIGQSWVDPIFNSSVRRLTNTLLDDGQLHSNIYSKNAWFNADATRFMEGYINGVNILDTTSGAFTNSGVPVGANLAEVSFDPVDPDIYYYWVGADLKSYRLSTATSATVKTFPATLEQLGGSVDWMDNSGRYMIFRWLDLVHVWDKKRDVIYTGTVNVHTSIDLENGYCGITPNGLYLIIVDTTNGHRSFAINHAAQTVNTVGVSYWTAGGQHSDTLSASDGISYAVVFQSTQSPLEVRARDISLAAGTLTEQRTNSRLLIDGLDILNDEGHMSGVAKGRFRDWCFLSLQGTDDLFNNQGAWRHHKSEIIAMNVVTGVVRRLCHSRTRSVNINYQYWPRICCAWDGTRVAWASNYNYNALQYADLYILDTCV